MSQSADAYLELSAGQAVYAEGDPGQTMYIIETGAIDLMLAARGSEAMASLGPGDFFGEAAMLENQPRFCSAIARAPTRLLGIERAGFADLLREDAGIAVAILGKLAQRHQQCEVRLAAALGELAGSKRKPANATLPDRKIPASATVPEAAKPSPKPKFVESRTTIEPPKASPPAAKLRGSCVLRHKSGRLFELDPAINDFLVGRPDSGAGINPEVNLSDIDPTRSLSRRHAKLVRQGQLFFVREETRTVNGTFVNNVRIETGVDMPIKPGDMLRFGAVEIEFSAA